MGCFVRGGKNGMGCFVRGGKNCMGCFVPGGKLMRDVLSPVLKNDVLSYIQTTRMLAREFKTLRIIQKKKIRKIKITRKFLNLQ